MELYGETGAQSSIVPAFDAVLGIRHPEGWLRGYLQDMRHHMPPAHRSFLALLEVGKPLCGDHSHFHGLFLVTPPASIFLCVLCGLVCYTGRCFVGPGVFFGLVPLYGLVYSLG